MQTEPINSTGKVPSTQVPESHQPTTQDGFHSAKPGSLDGRAQLGSGSLSPGSVAAGAHSASATRADQAERTCLLSDQEERHILPGERVSAYENATTPMLPQSMGFKVIKRSGASFEGPSLADCPNGMLSCFKR